jgi:O-Antigen ligase
MNGTSMRPRAALLEHVRGVDPAALATWLLSFGLIAYLGLKGGGYDPLVHDRVGIAIWWIALAGVVVGALPRRRPGNLAWAALGLLAAFVAWTALSLEWTESTWRTSADLARLAGYLGIFALAVFTRVSRESERLIAAVAAGIVLVTVVALLSRLHPAWFPAADQTANFIADSRERLSYPINYWNGLGALIAIGIPLVLQVATGARSILFRALAASALPAMVLTLFLTLSRGGIAAAAIAVAVFLAIAVDRLPKLLCALLTGAGGAILIALTDRRDALQHGLDNATARQQGDEILVIALVVCLAAGLIQAAISYGLLNDRRPRWTFVSRRNSLFAAIAGAFIVLILAGALDAPGRASDGWHEFQRGGNPGSGTGRLGSVAGQSRYQLWGAALDENATEPLTGTGSGTFELWWARDGDTGESVRDTHSLYLQTLGELGIVGLLLLVAFLAVIFAAGGRNALRAGPSERSPVAAALAGCLAFCLTAAVDWMWQIPVLAVALLLLASVLVTAGRRSDETGRPSLGVPIRVGLAFVAVAGIVAIAIPLATATLLRTSEADARAGSLNSALEAARTAQNVQPAAAAPRLQQALVLEEQGDFGAAAAAARAAIEREPTSWRNWLVLSRIEAERGRAGASVRDYRKARSLNSESPLFDR